MHGRSISVHDTLGSFVRYLSGFGPWNGYVKAKNLCLYSWNNSGSPFRCDNDRSIANDKEKKKKKTDASHLSLKVYCVRNKYFRYSVRSVNSAPSAALKKVMVVHDEYTQVFVLRTEIQRLPCAVTQS